MGPLELAIAGAVGVVAGALGAVAGGNSLLTVPALLLLGTGAHTAVATNMVGVTALSAAASFRFARAGAIPRHPTLGLAALAVPGGVAGAAVALALPDRALAIVVGVSMLALAIYLAFRPHFGAHPAPRSARILALGYALSALWAIYGGLFSGGYTTVLTVACVGLFGAPLREAIAATKVVNVASSAAATAVFAASGAVDPILAAVLVPSMAAGGYAGAHMAARAHPDRLRRALVALIAVFAGIVLAQALGLGW